MINWMSVGSGEKEVEVHRERLPLVDVLSNVHLSVKWESVVSDGFNVLMFKTCICLCAQRKQNISL